jgi:TetR/AcrR family transcriptional repressor of mexJK operon
MGILHRGRSKLASTNVTRRHNYKKGLSRAHAAASATVLRNRILQIAGRLFRTKGYPLTTIREIVARSKSSNATIVKYFGDKEGLFAAFVANEAEEFAAATKIEEGSDPSEALTAFGRCFLQFLMPMLVSYRAIIGAINQRPTIGLIIYTHIHNQAALALAHHLRRWTEIGKMDIRDYAGEAERFIQLIQAGVHTRCLFCVQSTYSLEDIDGAVAGAVGLFLHGVASTSRIAS